MEIKNLPKKYQKIWEISLPLLKAGRPGDDEHARETAESVLGYQGDIAVDLDVLVPAAIMHDIGHVAILPEHFKYVTGPEKIENGKLVHMLAGAKIARDILHSIGYDPKKTAEIVEIISTHDADQMKNVDLNKMYDTENKKIFHDLDSLDRYNERRLRSLSSVYKDRGEILKILEGMLKNFFYDEFRRIAEKNIADLKKDL